jgi:hypothetical protein
MHFSSTFVLLSNAALSAAAPPIPITPDSVILHGNGHFTLMSRSDFDSLNAARLSSTLPPKPSTLDPSLYTVTGNGNNSTKTHMTRRAGDTIIIPNPPSRFLGWDVLMSAVVKGAPTSISVSSGYSIANSVSVCVSSQITLVKDFLAASTSIDYSTTWTSTEMQQFTASVPVGQHGAFVSNAWTHRESRCMGGGYWWGGKFDGVSGR